MKYKDLVSVIVPAYNVDKYILKCVESIMGQTYDNLQIIVVDDGSSDDTYSVLEQIKSTDKRVQIIHKKNEGVSIARNVGLENAVGEYVCFVDGDDYINCRMIEILYNSMNKFQCDMSLCGYMNVFQDTEGDKCSLYSEDKCVGAKQYLEDMSKYLYTVYYGSLCNKMYVRNIIEKNNIRFQTEISLAEDLLFNLEYLKFCTDVYVNEEALYYYFQDREESLTKEDSVWYLWKMAKIRLEYCKKQYAAMGMLDVCNKNIDTAVANELIGPTYDIINDKKIKRKNAIEKLKMLYTSSFERDAIKNTNNPQMVHRIAKVALGLHSYTLFYMLMKVWVKVQRYEPEE